MQTLINFDVKTCSKCGRKDGSGLAFPEVFEIYPDGVCNVCKESFQRYLEKNKLKKNSNQKNI